MHNTGKIVMGGGISNIKDVRSKKGTLAAGTVAHRKSDGTLTALASDGPIAGISMGKDLSGTGMMSYCERGNGIPALLTAEFTPVERADVWYDPLTGKLATSSGSATALNAVYASGLLSGIAEDGTAVAAALIDFNLSL